MQDTLNSICLHTERLEMERNAYNAAFYGIGIQVVLGLRYLLDASGDAPRTKGRVRAYLETHQPHLLNAYDAIFLVEPSRVRETRFDAMAIDGQFQLTSRNSQRRRYIGDLNAIFSMQHWVRFETRGQTASARSTASRSRCISGDMFANLRADRRRVALAA